MSKRITKYLFNRKNKPNTPNKPNKKFSSLSKNYYIYAGFILSIVLLSLSWSAISLYKSQKNVLQNQLISQSQLIDSKLNNYFNYVSHIAEDKGHKIALKGDDLGNIAYLFKRNFFFPVTKAGLKRKAFIWPHFSWVDENRNVLVNSSAGVLPKRQKINNSKHLYQSTINSWQLNLSDPHDSKFEDESFIEASLGVSNLENEKYIGSIITKFNISKLVEAIKFDLKEETKFIILNEEIKIIIDPDNHLINDDDFFARELANITPNAGLVALKKKLKYRGNIYQIYKKSSEYPFIILTGYNNSSFNKEFVINFIEKFIILFGTTFVVFAILVFQRQRIIKPINNLAIIARKLGRGESDVEIENLNYSQKRKYASEINELYQGISLTKNLINNEKEINLKLIELNNKLEQQNEIAKKSTKSREKFLIETRQDIIEETMIKITKDIVRIIDHQEGNVVMTKQTLIDLNKKILGSCAKILSFVSDNLNFLPVNVEKIILEAIDMSHYEASINNVQLSTNIADKIADINIDERSIKHVIVALINYLMEDVKKGENNSFVKIGAKSKKEKGEKFLEIIFEDNGHGISEEMRMNFRQANSKESKNENNISLTLQAIRSILTSHKATLTINSQVGLGNVIMIKMPYGTEAIKVKNDLSKNFENVIDLFPEKNF
ncbi:MAG: signal transduction histidine kinase [Rickettsiales bacterium]